MSLAAWWKLDGNANDSSGNRYNGTVTGATSVAGKIGQCYSFDGVDDYISCGNTLSLTAAGTVSVWIKTNQLYPSASTSSFFRSIVGKVRGGGSGQQNFYMDWYGTNTYGRLRFGITDNVSVENSLYIEGLDLTKWTHFVGRFDGKKVTIFVNGVSVKEMVQTITPIATSDPLNIGNFFSPWDGLIDDVRIYDNALSDKEIYELSRAKVLHYKFDDFQEPTTNIWNQKYIWSTPTDGTTQTISFNITTTEMCTYTMSVDICMYSDDGTTNPRSTLAFHYSDGTESSVATSAHVKDGVWHHYTITGTPTAGKTLQYIRGWILDHSGVPTPKHSDVKNIQIEKKDHETPFVAGSRTGTVRDCSGYGNDGTLSDATTPKWISDSVIGLGAYEFNNQSILTSHMPMNSDQVTQSLWFYPYYLPSEQPSAYQNIMSEAGDSFNLFMYSTYIQWKLVFSDGSSGARTTVPESKILKNQWNHLVGTYDGSSAKLYINGALVGSTTPGLPLKALADTQFYIAKDNTSNTTDNFLGKLDDIRLYATALSDTDILELYQQRASLDDKGNLYAQSVEEARSHLIVSNVQRNISDNTYLTMGGFAVTEIDVSDFEESDHTLGNTFIEGWVYCSSASYYPTTFEYCYENNTKGFNSTFATTSGSWVVGWNHVKFPATGYANAANTPWNTMNRLEIYRSGPATGSDTTQYIILKDIRLRKFIDNKPLTQDLSESGIMRSAQINEVGPIDGLIGWWKLDKDTRDLSGGNIHGVANGAIPTNQGYSFDGVDDYIVANNPPPQPTSGGFTYSAWIKVSALTSDYAYCFHLHTGTGTDIGTTAVWAGLSGANQICVTIGGSTGAWSDGLTGVTPVLGQWYHIVGTWDGSTGRTYINGAEAKNYTKTNVTPSSASTSIYIGGRISYRQFNGSIYDTRIYSRALAPEEIAQLYALGIGTERMMFTEDGRVLISGEFKEVI